MHTPPLILIVDDEEDFLEIFSEKLKSVGFVVETAKTAKNALEKTEQHLPDLVLMDIHMPQQTGTDIALAIKQNQKTHDTKIAFLTALKEPWPAISGDRERVAKELGMEDFLEKTDDLDNIVKKINEILGRSVIPA